MHENDMYPLAWEIVGRDENGPILRAPPSRLAKDILNQMGYLSIDDLMYVMENATYGRPGVDDGNVENKPE